MGYNKDTVVPTNGATMAKFEVTKNDNNDDHHNNDYNDNDHDNSDDEYKSNYDDESHSTDARSIPVKDAICMSSIQ